MSTTTAIFVGSFDPYTIGHDNILRRALPMFDKVVIGVGVNESKKYMFSSEVRTAAIASLYADEPKVEVRAYSVDFARREDAQYIIKGVRNMKDFEYEREQADINRRLTGIDTVLLFSEPQLQHVSSSMVRELMHFGRDVAEFIPKK